jgi:ribosomal protein S18 acetylase RimI-like enzyme
VTRRAVRGEPVTRGIIEHFDPARHDRTAFSCGIEQVDNFFKKTANKLVKADNLRVYVMVDSAGALIGFYAINAHKVDYTDLPSRYARNRPGHGAIPAIYISMIGVDLRHARQGYGGDLLADCLKRIARIGGELGVSVVMLDVLDDGNPKLVEKRKRLYAGYGFTPLPANDMRLFLPLATVEQLIAKEE